jgi:CHAT domain-containing protein
VSRALLEPVADQLGAERIVVVADGILEALPFAALADPRRSRADGAFVPLVQEHEVVHLPSASTLALIRAAETAPKTWVKEVLVFADPVFEADDPRVPPRSRQARASQPAAAAGAQANARPLRSIDGAASLSRLMGSGQEARRIASLTTGADVRVGFQANVASALEPGVKDHRIVHFATHAIVDDERPELSGIALSLYDEHGVAREGFVRLYDVYNMKLPVDLVVLSGCSSAMGKRVTGEGLISLVRGFMYAGARQVLASLWKVDDEATAELMARFYRAMWKEGQAPSAALRTAQLELMSQKRWRHPFYWAGFVLSGDWDLRYSRGAQPANHGTDSSFRTARSAPPAARTGSRAGGTAIRAAAAQPDHGVRVPGLRQPRRARGRDARPGRPAAARAGQRLQRERPDAIRVRGGLERGARVVPAPQYRATAGVVGVAGAASRGIRGERAARPLPRALSQDARGRRSRAGASILRGREDREDPAARDPRGRAGAEPQRPAAPDTPDHEQAARVRLRVREARVEAGGGALELGRRRGVKEP